MSNHEVASLLRGVAAAYRIKDEAKFRFQIMAYEKASEAIDAASEELSDLAKDGKLTSVPGIGPSLAQHIEELFKTGKVKHFDWVMEDVPQALFPLLEVPSFGPKKAFKLVKHFKLENPKTVIDDLEKIAKAGKIASLEGFGEKSQSDILRAISEYRSGAGKTTRMVLPIAGEVGEKMITYLQQSKAVDKAEVLGSLRRRRETIGDVDIAVATEKPAEAIEHFVNYPQKGRIIEKGTLSASLLTSGGKQVDLMVLPIKSYGSLLQHFTGSKNHNVHLRELAIKKGMSLSEKGIKRVKDTKETLDTFATEEAFYKALGMQWIPPEMREDTGEIELALDNKLPKLVELSDIKGDLHDHSSYPIEPSHDMGQSSMEVMLEKAKKLGYSYLGFSEHNPSVSKHTKQQIYDILAKRQEKIEQLKLKIKGVRIINLLETDILANGDIPLDDKAFSCVDAILVSIHSSFSMNKKDMTKRVLAGFAHPKAKILSHPTGRLLNSRTGYELDFDEVFAFAKKNNKALEINAWPYRLDLPDVLVREAVKQGIKMSIDTDAHEVNQMDLMQYGVSVARRGWATTHDIINSWPYEKFSAWLTE
jgi:DNA polymerase (family 10)